MPRVFVTVAFCLALASLASAGEAPALDRIAELLGAALAPGTALSVATIDPALPAACVLRQVSPSRPLLASGRMALRLEGRGCPRWIWADLQLRTPPALPAAPAPVAGSRVRVLVRVGALSVEEDGRLVPCTRNRTCAVVSSGKHLEGQLENGILVVESP